MDLAQTIDFRALFAHLPSPYMILDRAFCYVEANAAYQQAVGRSREDLLGRNLFDLFPNPGEGGRLLRASFERVLETRAPDSIAYIPYAIPRPQTRGGGLEMRYWSAVHTPLHGADGEVAFIVQNTVDVTELHQLQQIAFGPSGGPAPPRLSETQLLQRAAEVQRANRFLLQETAQLRDMFMQAPGFMAVFTVPDLTFSFVNKALIQMVGSRPLIGRTIGEALPEVVEQGFVTLLNNAVRTRKPFIGRGMSLRLQRTPGGPLEERFVDFVYQPVLGPDGEVAGVFVEGSDVTDRVLGEVRRKLLVDELNHRVKNTLATVQAIAAQTLRTSRNPKAFKRDFEARLLALSATHNLLTETSWRSASLRDLLLTELRPHGRDRYDLSGPDVSLSPAEALSLGLIFHELATNAAKYGALSNSEGRIKVAWSLDGGDEARRLELTWSEEGGPPVSPPTRTGFGSRLIQHSMNRESGGEASLSFARHGLRCQIRLPLTVEVEAEPHSLNPPSMSLS